MTVDEAVRLKQEYLFPGVRAYYSKPLVLVDGNGVRVHDSTGREYLDLYGGILTVSVGHAHPHVVEAVKEQVDKISHTSTCYLNEPMLRLAERLAKITPGNLKKTFFSNSGTEANETAVFLAKIYTGNHDVIAVRHSYHGRSTLAAMLTGNSAWRPVDTEIPGIVHAHSPYCFRCAFHLEYPSCGLACAYDIEELIRTCTCGRIAAFIAEPIQGVGGFVTPPPEYFKIAVEIVRRYGGVFICDEVQTGWGRTGGKLFGIEHWGVEPDIMTFAKGLANGSPIGATVARAEIAEAFTAATISTFGGNPVTMAAAMATMDVIVDNNLPAHVAKVGEMCFGRLRSMQDRFPFVGEVRGKGLMMGVEITGENRAPAPDATTALMEAAREEGILIGRGGLYSNAIRIAPPMTISAEDAADGMDRFERALAKVASQF
ncbi:MAG: aspartate aminotransferase family protein [Firmicutes bacterium]|nr:aspartate aminotransferase family protein [Bacillota bacterium]